MTHRRCESKLDVRTSERGAALMLAILVLTTLTLVALYLGSSSSVNRRVASDEVTRSKALRYAEAGVMEAMALIQSGQGPDPAVANAPQKVVQVLLASTGGTIGPDTTLLPTGQPAGQWLPYSTPTSGGGTLTIEFRTNPARTQIYKYNKALNPPVQFTSGAPIYRITSVGRAGGVSRQLQVDAVHPKSFDLRGAFVCGTDLKYTGPNLTCGYNHRADTPDHKGIPDRNVLGGCNEDPGANEWETGSGDVPGDLVYGAFSKSGGNVHYGAPGVLDGQTGFYAGPWEVLGLTSAEFFAWVGPQVSLPASPNGVFYVDNDGIPGNRSCNVSYNAPVVGSGLLYVDGGLIVSNDFHFRGLVYTEGQFRPSNQAWILGQIVARGPPSGRNDVTGPNVFLFSRAAIAAIPGLPSGVGANKVKAITWKEER